MPSARPMYWARMRAGLDAADEMRAEVAVQDAQPVLAAIAYAAPDGDRLLAEAVVEGAGHLALAVEVHRALLDRAHEQHVTQQRHAVLGLQPAGGAGRPLGGARRLCRHPRLSLGPVRDLPPRRDAPGAGSPRADAS